MAGVFAFLLAPNWRSMVGMAAIPSLVQMVGMLFMPESPRWLGIKDRSTAQRKVMELIYQHESIDEANLTLTLEVNALRE